MPGSVLGTRETVVSKTRSSSPQTHMQQGRRLCQQRVQESGPGARPQSVRVPVGPCQGKERDTWLGREVQGDACRVNKRWCGQERHPGGSRRCEAAGPEGGHGSVAQSLAIAPQTAVWSGGDWPTPHTLMMGECKGEETDLNVSLFEPSTVVIWL